MRLMKHILSAFVLSLAVFSAILLFVRAGDLDLPEGMPPPIIDDIKSLTNNDAVSVFPDLISRLPMLPFTAEGKKLVAVIIENHEDARPYQMGLSQSLMIQEYMVEGLISRFAVLFDADRFPDVVGPVRSLRSYFIDTLLPFAHVVVHAGGSPDALERVKESADITSINGLQYDEKEFVRFSGAPAPHDLFTGRQYLAGILPSEIPVSDWPPYKTGGHLSGSGALKVRINFFNQNYNVEYVYRKNSRDYKRTNGGVESGAFPQNVLIMEVPINGEKEFGRLDIQPFGRGQALLFRNGKVIEGFWERRSLNEWFHFEMEKSGEMIFAKGLTWITAVPAMTRVRWE